jgi:NTP pyrophosphatase (non-canonical NTP hydrolase)
MTFDEYQQRASATDASEISKSEDFSILLLGLAGETGSLLTLYKKWLRDGDAFQVVDKRISEELGDILWYLSAIARRQQLSLDAIAEQNLKKTSSRWLGSRQHVLFDESCEVHERLPRTFVAELRDVDDGEGRYVTRMRLDGESLGAALTDNSYEQDGYRFHDLLHLAFVAILGWSPVIRSLLKRKRKSNLILDEVEDGGRAIAVEEGLAALVFTYASQHSMLDGVRTIDWFLLQTCSNMTMGLEAGQKPLFDWERSIIDAFAAWRLAIAERGVRVYGDLTNQEFRSESLRDNPPSQA